MTVAAEPRFTAAWLEQATGGRLHGDPHGHEVSTDSRRLPPGALFVALKGPHFDGHGFAAQAVAEGAGGVVVERNWWEGTPGTLPAVVVENTLEGLQAMAAAHRARMPVPLVAVTGSNGKTSTKEFIAACLRPLGPVHKTQGNFNNHVGLPLTLLSLTEAHRVSVVEMGMNHLGEIEVLSRLARPRVAVITNIAAAHLEGVGDRAGVARAKAEILAGLEPAGFLITPHGDPDLEPVLASAKVRRTTVGMDSRADYRWDAPTVTADGTGFRMFGPSLPADGAAVHTRMLGFHVAQNITLAVAAAAALGVPPLKAVESASQVPGLPGRLQLKRWGGLTVLDDTYNANPESLGRALSVLEAMPARRRLAVLGDMLELGPRAEALHRSAVEGVVLDGLVTFGKMSRVMAESARAAHHVHTEDPQVAVEAVLRWAEGDAAVLVKGSRGMQLERVLQALALWVGGPSDVV